MSQITSELEEWTVIEPKGKMNNSQKKGGSYRPGGQKDMSYRPGGQKDMSRKSSPGGQKDMSYRPKYLCNIKNLQKDSTHFLPKNIKTRVDDLMEGGISIRDLINEPIIKDIHYNATVRISVIVYILNQAASVDKLDYIEYILANVEDRTKIVNEKSGKMAYNAIIKAAYRGSIKAVKMLLCAEADLTSQNKEGETVLQALDQGLEDELGRNPGNSIFIRDRYAECKSFIINFRQAEDKNIVFKPFKSINALPIPSKEDSSKDDSSKDDSSKDDSSTSSLEDMSIPSFITEFSSNENKFKEFISSKDNVTNILIQIFTFMFENDMNNEYQDIIKIIKNIATDDTFKQNIISCFQDETILDLVRLDAPYAKEEMNNVCKILKI